MNNLTGYPSIDKPWMKYYSEELINSKLDEVTIYDYLYSRNKDHLDRVAIDFTIIDKLGNPVTLTSLTYGQLFEKISETAKALKALGIKKGDIVSISSVTTPEVIYLFYALSKIGAMSNMIDPRTSEDGINEYIKEAGSRKLFVLDNVYDKLSRSVIGTNVDEIIKISITDSFPHPIRFAINVKDKVLRSNDSFYNTSKWSEFIKRGKDYLDEVSIPYEKNRGVSIVHTGGTTGKSKGVILSNDNLNAAAYQCEYCGLDFRREHSWLNIMPPFIAYGIGNGLHLPLSVGMRVIVVANFDPNYMDKLLLKTKANHMTGVPTHWESVVNSKRLNKEDSLSSMICGIVGGDGLKLNLEKEINRALENHGCKEKIVKGYGMSEASAAVCCTTPITNKPGSVGVPFVKTTISIFDPDTGKELPYNTEGEVCMTGPNNMVGYYNNEEEEKKVLKVHDDGRVWVHSGDLGYMDEDGNLFIIGRLKRMLIRHDGFKVHPSTIESVINSHNAVLKCAVVGANDKYHDQGKLPVAFVVLKKEYIEDYDKIISELRDICFIKLAEYQQPEEFIITDDLPLTNIGKIDYKKLEESINNDMSKSIKKLQLK